MNDKFHTLREGEIALEHVRANNLARLLRPGSIAVIGASADLSKAGSQALAVLAGFPGKLFAVNPRETGIRGVPCFPTIADLPEAVDLAILAIPAVHCVKAAEEAAERGIGGVFVISGGFGETGPEGAELQTRLGAVCAQTGLRLLGPNTSGFINTHQNCVANFVPGVEKLAKGSIAVVAQSGGINLSLAFLIQGLGEGVSVAVGLGNAVDVTSADVLELLAQDDDSKAIALHLEGVAEGRRLFETLQRVTARKPVVALVAGRSDIGEFAVSHTGNLMGARQRTVAALQQAGAVVVETTEELAQAAAILSRLRLPPKEKNGFALVTGQAGPGLLIVDSLKSVGLDVPPLGEATTEKIGELLPPMTFMKNPVDTGRPGPSFPDVVKAVGSDAAIDAVLVFGLHEPSVLDPATALPPAMQATGKPVIFGTLGLAGDLAPGLAELKEFGVPAVMGPERLAHAAIVLDADSRTQWARAHSNAATAIEKAEVLDGSFDEDRAKALISSYGIAVPRRVLCEGPAEAKRAFEGLKRPVVVKIAASDVPHKTEVGGVILDVSDYAALDAALARIAQIPTAQPGRILLEEMAPKGVELIVGGVRDPSWGPVVVLGIGGVLTEALADTSVRLAPLSRVDVSAMLAGLRTGRLLDGFRDLPPCNRDAVTDAVLAIGRLLEEHPEIAEVEINPLRANAHEAVALDALVVTRQG